VKSRLLATAATASTTEQIGIELGPSGWRYPLIIRFAQGRSSVGLALPLAGNGRHAVGGERRSPLLKAFYRTVEQASGDAVNRSARFRFTLSVTSSMLIAATPISLSVSAKQRRLPKGDIDPVAGPMESQLLIQENRRH